MYFFASLECYTMIEWSNSEKVSMGYKPKLLFVVVVWVEFRMELINSFLHIFNGNFKNKYEKMKTLQLL